MEIIGKPFKFARYFQATKIIDNFGKKKIQLKYFKRTRCGGSNFNSFQAMYIHMSDWTEFKKELIKAEREKKRKKK